MALTVANTHYFTPVSNLDFFLRLIETLCGANGSVASTVTWTVVDSWDGTTREVPTGGLLANSTTKWAPGGTDPANNSWIVLQCLAGDRTTVHQSKWTLVSSSSLQVQLIPYADWTPGGGTGASPTIPSKITNATQLEVTTGTAPRAVVWDQSMVAIRSMNTTDATQANLYLGELSSWATVTDDARPFVHAGGSGSWVAISWQRISPINGTTLLTGGATTVTSIGSTSYLLGHWLEPCNVQFTNASHAHLAGTARHIACGGPQVTVNTRTTLGLTLGVRDWAVFRPSGENSYIRHDGTTLSADAVRLRESYDVTPPTGYPLVRSYPYLVRQTP